MLCCTPRIVYLWVYLAEREEAREDCQDGLVGALTVFYVYTYCITEYKPTSKFTPQNCQVIPNSTAIK